MYISLPWHVVVKVIPASSDVTTSIIDAKGRLVAVCRNADEAELIVRAVAFVEDDYDFEEYAKIRFLA